jgi:mono/diheme cytochrome c family protein
LVNFLTFDNLSACTVPDSADHASTNTGQTMKKLILITATLGFAAALSASAADGKTNWDSLCAKCHGADGKGQTTMGKKLGIKDLTDAKVQGELKDDTIAKTIKEGVKDKDGKTLMKAFDTLSDDETKALVQYVRSLKP